MEEEIEKLKTEIEILKSERQLKKISAYGALATPIVVALLGGYFAFFGKIEDNKTERYDTDAGFDIAEKDRWLEQSKFSKDLMGDFLGKDTIRAKMAIEIVSHADPNLGSRISKIVAESSQSSIKGFARNKRLELMDLQIRQLIYPEKSIRWNAAEGLLSYENNPNLIPKIISFAAEDKEAPKKSGGENWRIYNVTAVLLDLARTENPFIFKYKNEILDYLEWANKSDIRIKRFSNELESILNPL